MEPRISIITLGVTDFIRSLRFYRDGLGWPTRATETSDIAFFNTIGTRFAIYPLEKLAEDISPGLAPARAGFGGITLAHNVRAREEVAMVLAQAEAAGANVVKPAQHAFWGGHSGYFTDPDGYYWEVAFAPGFQFAEDGSLMLGELECPMQTPRLYRVILPVPDIERAAAFYTAVFDTPGLRVSPGRHYFDCGGTLLACYDPSADGDAGQGDWRFHPSQYLYFAVPDLEAVLARVQSAGGAVTEGIELMPWGERMFYAEDPFGSRLSFVDARTVYTG